MSNKNLDIAKKLKDDEFYTYYDDVEKELIHYKELLKGKIIYCNCDSENSNFYIYLKNNFINFELKELIATSYNKDGKGVINRVYLKNGVVKEEKVLMVGNGSFDSEESLDILGKCDIVITNPPFSLVRKFYDLLVKYQKDFLFISPITFFKYGNFFNDFKNKKVFINGSVKCFYSKAIQNKKEVGAVWITNLLNRNKSKFIFTKNYNNDYDFYDGFNIINVDKSKDIPDNYFDLIGVPISFLEKIDLDQFEVICLCVEINNKKEFKINGIGKFCRVVIKRKI